MKKHRQLIVFSVVIIEIALSGCISVQAKREPVAGTSPPEALLWYRSSAEMKAIYEQTYRAATEYVRSAAPGRAPRTWGVIMDADETILNNSEYQARLYRAGARFKEDTWDAWVKERRATPLPGAKNFIDTVHLLGGQVIVVTNRAESQCAATTENLSKVGIPVDRALCAPQGISDKNPRFDSIRNGDARSGAQPIDVIAFVGDNIQDFPRRTQQQPGDLRDFGRTEFILPNPLYGSWSKNPLPNP